MLCQFEQSFDVVLSSDPQDTFLHFNSSAHVVLSDAFVAQALPKSPTDHNVWAI